MNKYEREEFKELEAENQRLEKENSLLTSLVVLQFVAAVLLLITILLI